MATRLPLTEKQFQSWVTDTALRLGWRVWHAPTPMRNIGQGRWVPDKRGKGLPDLHLMHAQPAAMILAELKGDSGWPLSPEQKDYLRVAEKVALDVRITYQAALGPGYEQEVPFAVYVWTPDDRDDIERILRR
jgi:hypothetical protein